MSLKVGIDAKLYVLGTGTRASWGGTADAAGVYENSPPANLLVVDLAKDVTLNQTNTEADASDRSAPWKMVLPAMIDASIDVELNWDTTNLAFEKIRDAFYARTAIGVACLDGAKDTFGSEGIWADMVVTSFNRNEAMENVITANATLKPTKSTVAPQAVRSVAS